MNEWLYDVECRFADGSRSVYENLTLSDLTAVVGTFDNLDLKDCSITRADLTP